MKYWKLWSLLALSLVIFACSSDDSEGGKSQDDDSFDRSAMLANWADNLIIPAYTDFSEKTANLKAQSSAFTESPSEENLQNLRQSWKTTYLAFQNVSMFEIGKAEEVMFRKKLNIYPTNVSAIDAKLSDGNFDLSATTPSDERGFPALDYLLNGLGNTDAEIVSFYTTQPNANNYQNYLTALVENIDNLTQQVLTDWNTSYRDQFVDNTSATASGSVSKLTNDYIYYFEKSLRAGKIGIPAGVFSAEPLPETVEAVYQEDFSKQLFLKGLQASTNFFNGKKFNASSKGKSFQQYLVYLNTIKNGEDLDVLINGQFTTAESKANELSIDFKEQVITDNGKMQAAYDELQRIVILLKVDMVQALNVSIDYVDADGD